MPHKLYDAIPSISLNKPISYCHPPEQPVVAHLDDPALSVMTDFHHVRPVMINSDEFLPAALLEMKACHVHSVLVVDKQQNVVGLVTSEHMFGEKPIKISQERRIHRHDIPVSALMTSIANLLILDYHAVSLANAGSVAHTLSESGQRYAIVVDTDNKGKQSVRGIFSASLLSRQLGVSVYKSVDQAQSIAQLQHEIGKD